MTKDFLVVGAGTMGANYARLLTSGRVPGANLAGITDIDLARAEALAGPLGVPAFASLDEALASVRPAAAYIATPDALHRSPVEACAATGVAMLVEKPLATTNEDAEAMVAAVERSGVHAEVNYSNRWNPPFVRAKKAIDDGAIGAVRSMNVRLNNPIGSPRERLRWSSATTPAWFLMSHCLDLACWLGERTPVEVYATAAKGVLSAAGIDTYDWVHALVRFADGGDGVFESAWMLPDSWPGGVEFNFRVLGEHGLIDVDTTNQNITLVAGRAEFPGTLTWAADRLRSFVEALEGRPGTTVSFAEAAEVTRTLVAIHRSIETGRPEAV